MGSVEQKPKVISLNPRGEFEPPYWKNFEEYFYDAFSELQEIEDKYPSVMEAMELVEKAISNANRNYAEDIEQ